MFLKLDINSGRWRDLEGIWGMCFDEVVNLIKTVSRQNVAGQNVIGQNVTGKILASTHTNKKY